MGARQVPVMCCPCAPAAGDSTGSSPTNRHGATQNPFIYFDQLLQNLNHPFSQFFGLLRTILVCQIRSIPKLNPHSWIFEDITRSVIVHCESALVDMLLLNPDPIGYGHTPLFFAPLGENPVPTSMAKSQIPSPRPLPAPGAAFRILRGNTTSETSVQRVL